MKMKLLDKTCTLQNGGQAGGMGVEWSAQTYIKYATKDVSENDAKYISMIQSDMDPQDVAHLHMIKGTPMSHIVGNRTDMDLEDASYAKPGSAEWQMLDDAIWKARMDASQLIRDTIDQVYRHYKKSGEIAPEKNPYK